jgi:hypothetical protein
VRVALASVFLSVADANFAHDRRGERGYCLG